MENAAWFAVCRAITLNFRECLEALAERRMPIADCPVLSHSANQFTVTAKRTSVTHRGLADSVLISVSEGLLGQGSGTGQTTMARWPNRRHCSFQGGACIQ